MKKGQTVWFLLDPPIDYYYTGVIVANSVLPTIHTGTILKGGGTNEVQVTLNTINIPEDRRSVYGLPKSPPKMDKSLSNSTYRMEQGKISLKGNKRIYSSFQEAQLALIQYISNEFQWLDEQEDYW